VHELAQKEGIGGRKGKKKKEGGKRPHELIVDPSYSSAPCPEKDQGEKKREKKPTRKEKKKGEKNSDAGVWGFLAPNSSTPHEREEKEKGFQEKKKEGGEREKPLGNPRPFNSPHPLKE